jgi:hypothetical protein
MKILSDIMTEMEQRTCRFVTRRKHFVTLVDRVELIRI